MFIGSIGETGRKERLMKSRIALVCIALLSVFFIACPMPQVGVGTTKDVIGGDPNAPQSTGGSISVVNDEARNQAVYINETGQQFDVVAEEYPGGPLVRCVQMVDFKELEPSTDADALPVKAIVAGTRDDGTPGVWEIHADDSILLPQPEQTDDSTARCITSGDTTTLPDGLQVRLGWLFKVTAVSADGKIIVGVTKHPRGFTYNTTEVMATSSVAVYWRVYRLPYSRFLIVSSPHVIGVVTNPKRPAGWAPHDWNLSSVLSHLRQFFLGRFDSYLTTADSVQYDAAEAVYKVKGLDDLNLAATARIDKTTVMSVIEASDLTVGSVKFSPETADVSGTLNLSAEVKNLTFDGAQPGTLEFRLNQVLVAQVPTPAITADGSTGPITISASLGDRGLSAGVYNVSAKVIANAQDGEVITDNNTAAALDSNGAPAVLTLTSKSAETHPDLSITSVDPAAATVALADGEWPFAVVVKNVGDASSAVPTKLLYHVVNSNSGTSVDLSVTVPALDPAQKFTDSLNDYADKHLAKLGIAAGTNTITISVDSVANEKDMVPDNNKWASSVKLTVTNLQPDLTISVSPPPVDAIGTGAPWPLTVVVTNEGNASSAATELHYLVANANGGTPVDLWVTVPALAPGATFKDPLDRSTNTITNPPEWKADTPLTTLGITSGTNSVRISVGNKTDNAAFRVIYDEIVIDTYDPTDGRTLAENGSPWIGLWKSGDETPFAYDDGSAQAGRQPNQYYARIDYKGLPPGTYWIFVRASSPGDTFSYGIRVVTSLDVPYGDLGGRWLLGRVSEGASDEPLSGPPDTTDPSPYKPLVLGDPSSDHLSRFIIGDYGPPVVAGVNWMKLVLR